MNDLNQLQGDGLRNDWRPSSKSLLEQIKDEKVQTLVVWRQPISTSKFIKMIKPNIPYDDLFHIALNINNKYDIEKDNVGPRIVRGNYKGETLSLIAPYPEITIGQLVEKTLNRMGTNDFFEYSAYNLNCQNFIDNILSAIKVNNNVAKKFINQDIEQVVQSIGGSFAKKALDVFKTIGEAFNIVQEGGSHCQSGYGYGNTTMLSCPYSKDLPLSKVKF